MYDGYVGTSAGLYARYHGILVETTLLVPAVAEVWSIHTSLMV